MRIYAGIVGYKGIKGQQASQTLTKSKEGAAKETIRGSIIKMYVVCTSLPFPITDSLLLLLLRERKREIETETVTDLEGVN